MKFNLPDVTKKERVSLFLNLRDEESVDGVLFGDILEYRNHYPTGPCPGKATCPACAAGEFAKYKFAVNILVKEGKKGFVVKIFQQGIQFARDLQLINSLSALEKTPVTITRRRTGRSATDVRYSVVPSEEAKENFPKLDVLIKEAIPHDLASIVMKSTAVDSDEEEPFGGNT